MRHRAAVQRRREVAERLTRVARSDRFGEMEGTKDEAGHTHTHTTLPSLRFTNETQAASASFLIRTLPISLSSRSRTLPYIAFQA